MILRLSALGCYKAWLNGKELDAQIFLPGRTSYRYRVQVQEYDVSDLVKLCSPCRLYINFASLANNRFACEVSMLIYLCVTEEKLCCRDCPTKKVLFYPFPPFDPIKLNRVFTYF